MVNLHLLFPTPKELSMNPAGFDFAPGSIRVMKLKYDKIGFVPEFYYEENFTKTYDLSSDNFSEKDAEEIIQYFKKVKNRLGLKYVVCSLPEQKTYLFRIKLPIAAKKDLSSAILYQLEENVPIKANEASFDYFEISRNNKEIDLVVSVFHKKIIKIYTELLKKSGLIPISFQAESVALSNSIIKEGDRNPYLLIRLLPTRVNIGIVEDGVIQYTSEILVEADKVFNQTQSPEAEQLKKELNKVLIYWFTNKDVSGLHKKIETAIVVGHNAEKPEVIHFLESGLKIDVILGNVWNNCFDFKKNPPKIGKEKALDFSVAIGLAIKALKYEN